MNVFAIPSWWPEPSRGLLGGSFLEESFAAIARHHPDVHVDVALWGQGDFELSDARLQLIVNTQENLAYGYGRYIATQDPDTLDLWPCWELVRVSPVNVPRGFKLGLGGKVVPVSGDSWPERWAKIGGQRYDGGRMIALKNDPIWERLGDPKTFDDALGNPYPPFAFNSGYDVRDVSRKEAERLGVMAPNAPAPQPQTRDLLSDIHASAANFDRALQSALENDPELTIKDGVLGLRED